jgi:hypothetical protein
MTKFGSRELKEYGRKMAQKKMNGRDDDDEAAV